MTVFVGQLPLEFKYAKTAREASSGLRQLNAETGNPIRLQKVDSITGEVVRELVSGKEVGDGQFVQLTSEELDGAFAEREKEIRQVQVQDRKDIPAAYIKSVYTLTPTNKSFWSMIGGRLRETGKQMRLHFVEGRQEREAIIRFEGDAPVLYVLYFPSECKELRTDAVECKPEFKDKVDALFAKLSATEMSEAENVRDQVIEDLVVRKQMGEKIEVVEKPKMSKIEQTAEELLNASL